MYSCVVYGVVVYGNLYNGAIILHLNYLGLTAWLLYLKSD